MMISVVRTVGFSYRFTLGLRGGVGQLLCGGFRNMRTISCSEQVIDISVFSAVSFVISLARLF